MKTVLLASDREPHAPLARRCRLRHRVRAHVRALKLDRALAAGESPESELLLSLRAETMISMANRRALARALRRGVADGAPPLRPLGPALPLARREILQHRDLMHE